MIQNSIAKRTIDLTTLDELATKYGTDKQPSEHNYVSNYAKILKNVDVNSMLEIGLGNGASARMWRDYFPNSKIFCMEFFGEENKNKWDGADGIIEGIDIVSGDSTKEESWNNIPYGLDFIIDDGSHFPGDQIKTFALGFSHLKTNGIYVIEDTHCGLEEKYGASTELYQWFINLVVDQQSPVANWGGNFYSIRHAIQGMAKDILSFHLYRSMMVFERA